jgi:hypothetical protein
MRKYAEIREKQGSHQVRIICEIWVREPMRESGSDQGSRKPSRIGSRMVFWVVTGGRRLIRPALAA